MLKLYEKLCFLLYFNLKYEEMSDSLETLPNTPDPSGLISKVHCPWASLRPWETISGTLVPTQDYVKS